MLFKNHIIFSNYKNINLNFYENLTKKDSVIIKNSENINFIISSKFNKLVIQNCKNIIISLTSTISGIDIDKSSDVILVPYYPFDLKIIQCFKSFITLKIDDEYHDKIKKEELFKIINEYSYISLEDSIVN
jgi:hypothetical protein